MMLREGPRLRGTPPPWVGVGVADVVTGIAETVDVLIVLVEVKLVAVLSLVLLDVALCTTGCVLTRCKGVGVAVVVWAPPPEVTVVTGEVDLMMTVLGGAEATPVGVTPTTEAELGVAPVGGTVLTGETRTRRTLPSAETLTNLTGTILAPGGTM